MLRPTTTLTSSQARLASVQQHGSWKLVVPQDAWRGPNRYACGGRGAPQRDGQRRGFNSAQRSWPGHLQTLRNGRTRAHRRCPADPWAKPEGDVVVVHRKGKGCAQHAAALPLASGRPPVGLTLAPRPVDSSRGRHAAGLQPGARARSMHLLLVMPALGQAVPDAGGLFDLLLLLAARSNAGAGGTVAGSGRPPRPRPVRMAVGALADALAGPGASSASRRCMRRRLRMLATASSLLWMCLNVTTTIANLDVQVCGGGGGGGAEGRGGSRRVCRACVCVPWSRGGSARGRLFPSHHVALCLSSAQLHCSLLFPFPWSSRYLPLPPTPRRARAAPTPHVPSRPQHDQAGCVKALLDLAVSGPSALEMAMDLTQVVTDGGGQGWAGACARVPSGSTALLLLLLNNSQQQQGATGAGARCRVQG